MKAHGEKRVWLRDAKGPTLLAVFAWDGSKLACDFKNATFEEEAKGLGLLTADGVTRVTPRQGKAFWQALDHAFARSTFVEVEAVR